MRQDSPDTRFREEAKGEGRWIRLEPYKLFFSFFILRDTIGYSPSVGELEMPGYRSGDLLKGHRTPCYFDYFLSFDQSRRACLLGLLSDH